MRAALVMTMLVLLAGPVAAGPLEDGLTAYNRQDYVAAVRVWRPIADQGDASAQLNLGYMYANGPMREKNMTSITVDLRPGETEPKVLLAVGRMLLELGAEGTQPKVAEDPIYKRRVLVEPEDTTTGNDLAAKLAEANTGTVQGWNETDTGALVPASPTEAPPAVDAQGLPWDARIHSETKALNKDDTWRRRRNSGNLAGSASTNLGTPMARGKAGTEDLRGEDDNDRRGGDNPHDP